MSGPTEDEHPVPATLDAFEKVFQSIKDLAIIGAISPTEDELLARLTGQLHELHEQFGERVMLEALAGSEFAGEEDTSNLRQKLQSRLVIQAGADPGSALAELATQDLFDTLDEDDTH